MIYERFLEIYFDIQSCCLQNLQVSGQMKCYLAIPQQTVLCGRVEDISGRGVQGRPTYGYLSAEVNQDKKKQYINSHFKLKSIGNLDVRIYLRHKNILNIDFMVNNFVDSSYARIVLRTLSCKITNYVTEIKHPFLFSTRVVPLPVVLSCYSCRGHARVYKTCDCRVHPGYHLGLCHTETPKGQQLVGALVKCVHYQCLFCGKPLQYLRL